MGDWFWALELGASCMVIQAGSVRGVWWKDYLQSAGWVKGELLRLGKYPRIATLAHDTPRLEVGGQSRDLDRVTAFGRDTQRLPVLPSTWFHLLISSPPAAASHWPNSDREDVH